MQLNEIIIFCQAPADIPYVLTIYEEHHQNVRISIFVVNVEGMYTFFFELKLNLYQLIYIPYLLVNSKHVHLLRLERARIKLIWKQYFSNIEEGQVYFFSRFEDWLTSAFIHQFSKKNNVQIIYANHYDDSANLFVSHNSIPLKTKIYLSVLRYLTRVKFNGHIREKFPEFPVESYSLKEIKPNVSDKIFIKYRYIPNNIDKRVPNLLFFVSPCEETIFESNSYKQTLIKVFDQFHNLGYKITIKGHPRLGTPDSIKRIADFEIPMYVPGEFIDVSCFDICIGIYTTAICHFSADHLLPTFSVIKLFNSASDDLFATAVNYLLQQSNNRMLFISNDEDLKNIALRYLK